MPSTARKPASRTKTRRLKGLQFLLGGPGTERPMNYAYHYHCESREAFDEHLHRLGLVHFSAKDVLANQLWPKTWTCPLGYDEHTDNGNKWKPPLSWSSASRRGTDCTPGRTRRALIAVLHKVQSQFGYLAAASRRGGPTDGARGQGGRRGQFTILPAEAARQIHINVCPGNFAAT